MADDRKPWIRKVVEVFLEELGVPPRDPDEIKLRDKIMQVILWRMNGLDHRRCGLLAADMYRLTHNVRKRIIEETAKVAVKANEDLTPKPEDEPKAGA